jgi:hypothetical protein
MSKGETSKGMAEARIREEPDSKLRWEEFTAVTDMKTTFFMSPT